MHNVIWCCSVSFILCRIFHLVYIVTCTFLVFTIAFHSVCFSVDCQVSLMIKNVRLRSLELVECWTTLSESSDVWWQTNWWNYTVSQKETPTLSIVTLRRINGFWRFLAQIIIIIIIIADNAGLQLTLISLWQLYDKIQAKTHMQ